MDPCEDGEAKREGGTNIRVIFSGRWYDCCADSFFHNCLENYLYLKLLTVISRYIHKD